MKSLSGIHSKTNKNTKSKPRTTLNPTNNAESVIDCNNSGGQSDEVCDNEFDPTLSMNNSAIFDGVDQKFWSYENLGFYSLPSRGNKRFRRPGIKFMINSETVSQTKLLVYKDHQKSQNLPFSNPLNPKKLNLSQSSSSSSLNSNNDPDTTAALDQIASEMGLIEHPVVRQSNDPVKYLLAKRSFSERISSTKNNFESNSCAVRSHSHLEQKKQPLPPSNSKENVSLSNSSPIQSSNKKQSRISRIIEKISPSLSRRSKSFSSTKSKIPVSDPRNLKSNNSNNINNSINKEVKPKICDKVLSSESSKPTSESSQNKNQLTYVNENSKKILNSLKIDRIDHLQNKFRNISKRRTEVNGICQTIDIIPKRNADALHASGSDYSKNYVLDNKSMKYPFQNQPITSARYVNVSLCAFGYGPHQRAYQSPFDIGPVNASNINQIPESIPNDSNNQFDEETPQRKHIKDLL